MDHVRDPQEILGDYLAADTPAEWLFGEISGYLLEGIDGGERAERLEEFFARLPDERAAYLSRQLLPDHLVQFTLRVTGRDGEVAQMSFSELPSPAVLLELCFKLADVGDQITVRHICTPRGW